MKLIVHPYTLPLANPFRIAHGSRTEQPTLIVELNAGVMGTRLSGYGEATMTSYYGLDSKECTAVLTALAPAFAQLKNLNTKELHGLLDNLSPGISPFLRCALDVALQDLSARIAEVPLRHLWRGKAREDWLDNYGESELKKTPTCYTIGLAPIPEMIRKLKAFPWPIYKIKLGVGDDDLAIIRALREHTDSPFYVDANTGWTAKQTVAFSHELKALGVVFIEQPLKTDDLDGQREVFQHSALPIIADESCQTEADVERCAKYFHGINIKIVKCGGLTPARRMIAQARKLNLKVMAGCMTESSVGISAIAQLLPELDYADMDGAMLLAEDPAQGVTFDPETGFAVYPERYGTGVELVC
jgi:L-alanine-DL-glutamate epimerase-like enolase superfamily enzyme